MPVIKCKIRGDGKGGDETAGKGGRQITNLGNTIRGQREKERDRAYTATEGEREREREGGKERVLLAREANKAFVPASSLDTQIKSFCREPGLFPLYANQRHTAAR